MKKTSLIVYASALAIIFFMCSYREGAATRGWDCTGGETGLSNPVGCTGGGCHANSATPGIVVTLQLDSAGAPVSSYKGGGTYTVTIRGVNTTSSTLPKFGFQVAAFQGSTAQVTPVNEGTFQQTGLPANVHYEASVNLTYTVANVVEQSLPLSPDSGTGGNGTVYKESFNWTAPTSGTGTVSFWGVLNAVNNNSVQDAGDLWNTTSLVIPEDTAKTVNSVAQIAGNLEVLIYPNPAAEIVQVELNNTVHGTYDLNVFKADGSRVMSQIIDVTDNFSTTRLNTAGWSAGIYFVKLSKDGEQRVVRVVKK